jgi:hypothetical protein
MAGETTDISAIEQLSLCLRYYDCNEKTICDFVCFLDVLDKEYGSNPGNPGEVVVNQDSIPGQWIIFCRDAKKKIKMRLRLKNQNLLERSQPRIQGLCAVQMLWWKGNWETNCERN